MAGEAGGDPRGWLTVDETAADFLSRSLSTRPPILLPPPLHRVPLRPGNVVEIAGPSSSGKSQMLLMAAVQCILPKEWEGAYFGGLGKAAMYLDLDCRFDVLRLAEILRRRIEEGYGSARAKEEIQTDGTKDKIPCSSKDTLFSDCMKRFLYVRCYDSYELISALKTLHSQSEARKGVLSAGIYFLLIDSIGAFYWVDRGPQSIRESTGYQCTKTLSLQSITETVVEEIRKFLQLQPFLVLVTKAPIYSEGITTASDFQRGTSKYMSEDSKVTAYSRWEEERNISCREYMPSVWQSFITHRIKLQDLGLPFMQENEMQSIYTCEWVQPSLNTKEKFSIRDDGVFLVH